MTNEQETTRLWGGRFSDGPSEALAVSKQAIALKPLIKAMKRWQQNAAGRW